MPTIEKVEAELTPVTNKKRRRFVPTALMSPGMIWLLLFFFVPLVTLFIKSLSKIPESNRFAEPEFAWNWTNYSDAFSNYGDHFRRSFQYAGIATIIALLLAFPLAYVIAFRGGRWKNFWMGLVMVPFFTNFLIRTLAWKTILGRQGPLSNIHIDLGIFEFTTPTVSVLGSPSAVIGGLTYNFLPFMVLPLYVALEKIDPRLIDAARDLYANTFTAFRKIVLPLAMPGIFAGSLLVFIPAAGDFVNDYYLGDTQNRMIGFVIQNQFLGQSDFPVAAAISFVFMLIVLVLFIAYSSAFDAEDLAG